MSVQLIHRDKQPGFRELLLTSMMFLSLPLQAEPAPPLETGEAAYVAVSNERVLDALVEAVKETTVSAQINGRITKINYDVDDYVEKDAVLLEFRNKEPLARYEAALAGYEEAKSSFARMQELHGKKMVAKSALDKEEARLKSSRAKLDETRENLENTKVRAPYSGIVVKRHAELGELASLGQPLFTGISLENLRATASVPEDIINTVRKEKKARVIINRDSTQSVLAESLTISPYADPATHTFTVRVNLPAGEYKIYPGMFVKVAFVIGEDRQLVVPLSALARRSEVSAVYTVDANNRVHFRQVRVGHQLADNNVIILAGLDAGEKVALDPVKAAIFYKEQQQLAKPAGDKK